MKQIVSFSGGIGSFAVIDKLLQKHEPEDIVVVFCDTLAESGDLYRFVDDVEEKTDLQITRLCAGKTPFELAFDNNFLYNSRIAACSYELKSKPFNEWLVANYKPEECVIHFGIDYTESHRCEAITKNYKPYKTKYILVEEPMAKCDMMSLLPKYGIEQPRMYKDGFAHNNCNGICFKAGIGHYRNLLEKDRETYLVAENKERMIRQQLGKDVAIMKRKGKPFTLRELRHIVDNQPEQLSLFELNDIGGCGCFVDSDLKLSDELKRQMEDD